MDPTLRIGVDLGGTKTEGVVVRLRAGGGPPEVLARLRRPTQRDQGYQHVLDGTAAVIREVAQEAGLGAQLPPIGVGMPGNVTRLADGTELVKNANTTCLNGRPFRADLARLLGRPLRFANDANCFALAEVACGAAAGSAMTFGVILGTGVGGGVVVGGALAGGQGPRFWDGAQGIAGEWGHVTLEADGPPCYCGRRGCVETFLSGPALEAAYQARSGHARTLRDIAASVNTGAADAPGDPIARQVLDEFIGRFGRALSLIVNTLDPEVIVIGGGVSNLPQLYWEGVEALRPFVFTDPSAALRTRVVQNALGDSAGVLGAAYLA